MQTGQDAPQGDSPRPAELDLFETVDDLVETHDQVSPVRDEQSTGTVEAWQVIEERASRR